MKKIQTDLAPKAVGPYSQAVTIPSNQSLVFVSGQLPIDPKTGKLVDGDIKLIANRVIDNIEGILISAGSNLKKVIRVEVFMTNLSEFSDMNEVYALRFNGEIVPARQTIQVAALPMNSRLEISCIAFI